MRQTLAHGVNLSRQDFNLADSHSHHRVGRKEHPRLPRYDEGNYWNALKAISQHCGRYSVGITDRQHASQVDCVSQCHVPPFVGISFAGSSKCQQETIIYV